MPTLDAACAFAEHVRAMRFRDPDAVFVVDDETGAIVDVAARRAEPEVTGVRPSGSENGAGQSDVSIRLEQLLCAARDACVQLASERTSDDDAGGWSDVLRTMEAAIDALRMRSGSQPPPAGLHPVGEELGDAGPEWRVYGTGKPRPKLGGG